MYSKKEQCPACDRKIDVRGMATHLRSQHPDYGVKKPVQSVTPSEIQKSNLVSFELSKVLEIYRKGYEDGRRAA